MKKIIASLIIVIASVLSLSASAGMTQGAFQVSLTIIPSNGCNNNYCVINMDKVVKDIRNNSNKEMYKASKKDDVVTIEF